MAQGGGGAGWVIAFFLGIPILYAWVASAISNQAKRKASQIVAEQESTFRAQLLAQKRDAEAALKLQREETNAQLHQLHEVRSEFDRDFIAGRKWLAAAIGELDQARTLRIAEQLETKGRPAPKAADAVREASKKRREAVERLKFLEFQLATYKEYFPILEEFEEVILNERLEFSVDSTSNDELLDNADRTILFVSEEEYRKLPAVERNQLALDRYLQRNKSSLEIGRLYERFLGYEYESAGWDVTFFGAMKGFEDLGRDLICRKGNQTHIVQAKCWARDKTIHEKHIFQLFGSTLLYQLSHTEQKKVRSVFVTTTKVSDVAREAAKRLDVDLREGHALNQAYPMIKCNINQRGKIYHLPFDQQYDKTKIILGTGECYVRSAFEAEKRGFRRAKRYVATTTA